jgi:hypothetical protein
MDVVGEAESSVLGGPSRFLLPVYVTLVSESIMDEGAGLQLAQEQV